MTEGDQVGRAASLNESSRGNRARVRAAGAAFVFDPYGQAARSSLHERLPSFGSRLSMLWIEHPIRDEITHGFGTSGEQEPDRLHAEAIRERAVGIGSVDAEDSSEMI